MISRQFLQLIVTEREQRLRAVQDRWDRVRQAIVARAAGDYRAMMATGVVCRWWKQIKRGKKMVLVEEYEIDTGAIEALNSIEKRAAVETGQEQEQIQVTGQISQKSMTLAKVFSLEELEENEAADGPGDGSGEPAKANFSPKSVVRSEPSCKGLAEVCTLNSNCAEKMLSFPINHQVVRTNVVELADVGIYLCWSKSPKGDR